MINVHNLVKLDKYTNIIPLPRLILMTRSFEPIGVIPNYTAWRCSLRGNDLDEISFEVTKYVNGVLNPVWDDLVDLKIVSLEHGGKFEIQVTYTDESKTTKSVNGVSLETELGQVALYDFHVNDDFAIEAEDYSPTVLYDPTDKPHSLLHRVLADKAPSWTINGNKMTDYVISDEEGEPEPVNRFQRTYTVDRTTIYDFLTGEVAKDANVVFRFDTDERQLWCESLVNYVNKQGVEVVDAVGEDTTILVSKKKLGNEITINSNKDSVKNCFRIEGGDDLLTSQVAVVNMTGTNYIYHFADFQLNDMPVTLKNAILDYEAWTGSDELQEEFYGVNGLYTRFVDANELLYYYKDSMAPSIHVDPPATAEIQWGLLKNKLEANDMYIGVSDLTSYDSQYYVGVTNNVKTMLEVWCDSRYKVDLVDEYTPTYNASTHTWTGVFRVTRFSDTTNHYPPVKDNPAQYEPFVFTAKIAQDSDTDLTYTRQKVEISLAKGEMSRVDAEFNDQTTYEEMVEYFEQWNLVKLQSFQVGYQTCQSVLMSGMNLKLEDEEDPKREIAEQLYAVYTERLKAVNEVLEIRQDQVNKQQEIVDTLAGHTDEKGNYIKGEIQKFQENLAFDKYLKDSYGQTEGERLYKVYRSYIREDTYQNSYYTSDDLETQEKLTENAKKLLYQAERELKNSCVLQRTMTVNLNNLLALPEFEPLYNKFELFNYIRVRTDDEVLKLRLIGVDYSGNSMESIEVTFSDQIESVDGNISDLQSVLDQARSIATSYSSTQYKAEQGASARNYVAEIIDNGLNAASTMLKNSDDNEIEITRAGILAKRMDDQGLYGDKQLRIIGNGMYLTNDAWDSVAMAVGEIQFTDPISQETSWKYGVIADAIVGKILVGENMYIGNSSGSVTINGDGITITNGNITWGSSNVNSPTISDIPSLSTTLTTMANEIEQLDGRIQTYSQPNDPSVDWTTTEEKENHIGDIWYDTTNELTKRYSKNGSTYLWEEVHDSDLENLAKSKATVFVAKPTSYSAKDLWILESDSVHSPNKEGSILVATTTSSTYNASHWIEDVRYTDDTTANEALTKARQGVEDAAAALARANAVDTAAQGYASDAETNAKNASDPRGSASTAESNAKSYADSQDTAQTTSITTAYQNYVGTKVGTLDHAVADYLGVNGSTMVGSNYTISPYIGAGYLNVTNNTVRVIIDPSNQSQTGYILAAMKTSGTDQGVKFGVDSSGNAVFTGNVTATSLTLGSGVTVPYSSVSGTPDLTVYVAKDGTIGQTPAEGVTGFVVSSAGLLQASNAIIYGTLYAGAGLIGGWTINSANMSAICTLGSSGVSDTYVLSLIGANEQGNQQVRIRSSATRKINDVIQSIEYTELSTGYLSIGYQSRQNKGHELYITTSELYTSFVNNFSSYTTTSGDATFQFVAKTESGTFSILEVSATINSDRTISSTGNIIANANMQMYGHLIVTGTISVSGDITGNVTGNVSGTASNVTGTVAIANGGTGATTRLDAAKNLTNQAVASPNYVVGLTTSWGTFGYTSIAQLSSSVLTSYNSTMNITTTAGNEIRLGSGGTGSNNTRITLSASGGNLLTWSSGLYVYNAAGTGWSPAYASAFNTQSSRKTKKNIKDMTNKEANKLFDLRPVKFDYKNEENGTNCYGLIAEEVEAAGLTYPLSHLKDIGTNEDILGLDYSRFVPYLIKVVQNQQTEIDQLKELLANK